MYVKRKFMQVQGKFITHKSLKESYHRIPRATILFKHDNGRNRDFLCIFELSAENIITTICAVASIKEDPFRRFQEDHRPEFGNDRRRRLVTRRSLCNPGTIQEELSPCLDKLPEEVLCTVCTKLDIPVIGLGNWRHVGTSLGFTEEEIQLFRNETLVPGGSPCTVMLEALKVKSPQFTVTEFMEILQTRKIQRFDVVDVLEPYLHEPVTNINRA